MLIKCMSFLGALPKSVWCAGHQYHDTVNAGARSRPWSPAVYGGARFADCDQLHSYYMVLGPHRALPNSTVRDNYGFQLWGRNSAGDLCWHVITATRPFSKMIQFSMGEASSLYLSDYCNFLLLFLPSLLHACLLLADSHQDFA